MRLEKASHKAIVYACMNFHYAKSVPVIQSGFSVFNDNNEWCGIILYSSGASINIGKPYNLPQGAICELVRVALNGKQESVSKVVSISLKLLKKNNPLLKLVISYADIDQEHMGIIYQASNWYYTGETAIGMSSFMIHGKKTHNKSVHSKGVIQSLNEVRKHLDPNATKFYSKGKRKYLYPLTKELIPLCKSLSKPYPKKQPAELPHKGEGESFQIQGAFDSTVPLKV